MGDDILTDNRIFIEFDGGVKFRTFSLSASDITSVSVDPREWHTYRIEWVPGKAKLYVDGEFIATHDAGVPVERLHLAFLTTSNGMDNVSTLEIDRVSFRPAYKFDWVFTPEKYGYYEFISTADDSAGNFENKDREVTENLAESEVRVAKDLVRVAVILAESNDFNVSKNTDGTYAVDVKQGMDVFSPNAWTAAIDNVPDNIFTRNPAQHKTSLKNKFNAIFKMIKENEFTAAIDKLSNDILKKLDFDGQADWVKQPVLVDEIRVLMEIVENDV